MKRISLNVFYCLILLVPHLASSDWIQTNGPFGGAVRCLAKTGEDIFAGTFKTGIYRSSDNGRYWLSMGGLQGYENSTVNDIAVDGSTIYVAHSFGVYRSFDKGASWSRTGSVSFVECLLKKDSCLFAGTVFNGVVVSTDSGKSWTPCNTGLLKTDSSKPRINALATDGERIYAGTDPDVFVSSDNGTTWSRIVAMSGKYIERFAIHGDTVFAAGSRKLYLSTHDSSWTDITPNVTTDNITMLQSLGLKGADIYAGLDSSRIAKSVDNGGRWEILRLPAHANTFVYSLLVKDNSIFAGTSDGVFVSEDDGQSWISIDSGMINSYVTSLVVRGNCLYASQLSKVALSRDEGATWERAHAGRPDNPIQYILQCDSNLLGITPDGFYLSDGAGENWSKINSSQPPLNCRDFTVDKESLFAWKKDSVYLSRDTGASWSACCRTPSYPKFLTARDGKLYAGTTFDGLFVYDTNQSAWVNTYEDSEENSTTIYSFNFHDNAMYICANSSQFCSYDKGETWNPVFADLDGPTITAWAMSGDFFLAGATNVYSVYVSPDRGATWSPTRYGQQFNTLSLARLGNTGFAGTDGGGVWRYSLSDTVSIDHKAGSRGMPDFEMKFSGQGAKTMTINFSLKKPEQVTFRILDIRGRAVGEFQGRYPCAGSYSQRIDGLKLVSGCYLMSIQTGNSTWVKNFAITR